MRTRLFIPIALMATLLLAASAHAVVFPAVSTGSAKNVTFSGALLTGSVNPHRQATNYYFEYGPTTRYGTQTPLTPIGNGTSIVKVSEQINGLSAVTKYHYRLVAVGAGGTARGTDRTLTTTKIPLSLSIAAVPFPVVFGNPMIIEGTLAGTGNANRDVILQANPYPYNAGFSNIGDAHLTNAAGGFSFPFPGLVQNAQLRVVSLGAPTVISATIFENVAVAVSIRVHHTRRHGFARITGTVTPPEVGSSVAIQRLKARGGFVNVGATTVLRGNATSARFARNIRVPRPGVYRAFVQVTGAQVSNVSRTVLIK